MQMKQVFIKLQYFIFLIKLSDNERLYLVLTTSPNL